MSRRIKNIPKKFNRLNSKSFLVVFGIFIFLFNFSFKVNTNAVAPSEEINIENLLYVHNQTRLENNLKELKININLNESAQKKAQAMLDSNCWSHYCPNGKSPWEFFNDASYDFVFAGENLGEGFYNINNLMNAWMNSPSHRQNIINSNSTEAGFGIVRGDFQGNENNIIAVVHFGDRQIKAIDSRLLIEKPLDGSEVDSSSLEISGVAENLEDLTVYKNNSPDSKGRIEEGLFTARISTLDSGSNTIFVKGVTPDGQEIESNRIKVTYNTSETIPVTLSQSFLPSIAGDAKNTVNFVFVAILGLIFVVDLFAVSRTNILTRNKSFSHFHLAIFIIVACVIVIGGFNGNISQGIGI